MNTNLMVRFWVGSFVILTNLVACKARDPDNATLRAKNPNRVVAVGAVYAATNRPRNSVAHFDRAANGVLRIVDVVPTGGTGVSGRPGIDPTDPIGSQNSVVLSPDNRLLFVVNAGSDEITSFAIHPTSRRLKPISKVNSGGLFPNSLAVHPRSRILYVLNAGGKGNIAGFTYDTDGRLSPIRNSRRNLHVPGGKNPPLFIESPAQISFTPSGKSLLISIKKTNELRLIPFANVAPANTQPVIRKSPGLIPFGFDFDPSGRVFVAEAFGSAPSVPTPNAGAVSSYSLFREDVGRLLLVTKSLNNQQTATCWVKFIPGITENNTSLVAATNNASNSVSLYEFNRVSGQLRLVNGRAASTGATPLDLTVTRDGNFVYVLNTGDGTISGYRADKRRKLLVPVGVFDGKSPEGLPPNIGVAGIAAF